MSSFLICQTGPYQAADMHSTASLHSTIQQLRDCRPSTLLAQPLIPRSTFTPREAAEEFGGDYSQNSRVVAQDLGDLNSNHRFNHGNSEGANEVELLNHSLMSRLKALSGFLQIHSDLSVHDTHTHGMYSCTIWKLQIVHLAIVLTNSYHKAKAINYVKFVIAFSTSILILSSGAAV